MVATLLLCPSVIVLCYPSPRQRRGDTAKTSNEYMIINNCWSRVYCHIFFFLLNYIYIDLVSGWRWLKVKEYALLTISCENQHSVIIPSYRHYLICLTAAVHTWSIVGIWSVIQSSTTDIQQSLLSCFSSCFQVILFIPKLIQPKQFQLHNPAVPSVFYFLTKQGHRDQS